jgi:hypothetical protein
LKDAPLQKTVNPFTNPQIEIKEFIPVQELLSSLPDESLRFKKTRRRGKKFRRGKMDISELNSQKTYETLPEQLAQLKQSMIMANSGEQSHFTKIVSDEESCLFSINSQIMDLIN